MDRRRFVSLAARISAWVAGSRVGRTWAATAAPRAVFPPAAPDADSGRLRLLAVLDEIVPAGDTMPSASAAGALAYFERRRSDDAEFAQSLDAALGALDRLCHESSGGAFGEASLEQRKEALRSLESQQPRLFADLRDTTYEAYYTTPAVQKNIGYDFRTGAAPTAPLPAFGESLLARVRGLPPFFRKAEP